MKHINWVVRFNKQNLSFIIRFVGALLVPILTYLGLKMEDLTTWASLGTVLLQFISNPFLVMLTLGNAFNMVPDPTTKGLGDSKRAMTYEVPSK